MPVTTRAEALRSRVTTVVESEPNTLAKELWFTSYRKNKPTKFDSIVYNRCIALVLASITWRYP
jgi:hypothetical protein